MVSGAYSVGQNNLRGSPPRPSESPPLPPLIRVINPPPSPPPRVSSLFNYLPEDNNLDYKHDKWGPGRLPIYRAESPSNPEDGPTGTKCCCRARRGVSLASALLTAAAALLALLLLLGAIAYFLLLADSSGPAEQSRARIAEATTRNIIDKKMPSYVPPPPRPAPTEGTNKDVTARSTERSVVSSTSTPHHGKGEEEEEPLFKDIVVSYQPYQPPPSVNPGDVVTAGFVPHWFREELTNTGEVRSSTPNRFTTTSPVHVSPTLPSALSRAVTISQNNTTETSALCHSPRLEACRGVLPYDLTTLQTGAVGAATAGLEAAAGALGFAHVARGACRLAARQLLCALLEPPCQPDNRVLQPCRAACQAAVSECGEFLLATLGLGTEFDCQRYPDSRDSTVCVDLTQDCDAPSMRCASSGACVPPQWRCDTRDDCNDSSDERGCRNLSTPSLRSPPPPIVTNARAPPACRPGQARCLDGACIESAQLCDGIQNCSRGEDEAVCPPS